MLNRGYYTFAVWSRQLYSFDIKAESDALCGCKCITYRTMWVFSQLLWIMPLGIRMLIRSDQSAIPPCSTWKTCLCHWCTGTEPWKQIHRDPIFPNFICKWLLIAFLSLLLLSHVTAVLSFTCGLMCTVSSGPYHNLEWYHDPYFRGELMRLRGEGLSQACSWWEEGPGPAAVPPTHTEPWQGRSLGAQCSVREQRQVLAIGSSCGFSMTCLETHALT